MKPEEKFCPFLDAEGAHCDRHLRLDRLKWAFDYCFARYEECPEHARLIRESTDDPELDQQHEAFRKALLHLKIRG